MQSVTIEQEFLERVRAQVQLEAMGEDYYRVNTPFEFDDGDSVVVALRRNGKDWVLSDEGHTYFHLTHYIDERDLLSGHRKAIIDTALTLFEVEDKEGELVAKVEEENFGSALFSFVQAILRIADVTYLSKEQVRSTFMEDIGHLIQTTVRKGATTSDWHDPIRDPHGYYPVDWRINGTPEPTFVFALSSPTRAKDAIVTLQRFQIWEVPNRPIGIYEDKRKIGQRDQARLADVCPVSFDGLREWTTIGDVISQSQII